MPASSRLPSLDTSNSRGESAGSRRMGCRRCALRGHVKNALKKTTVNSEHPAHTINDVVNMVGAVFPISISVS